MSRVYLLPGMGADDRMYPGAWHGLGDAVRVNWPRYQGEESIDAVVWRIVAEYSIDPGSIVVGCSLGGMVGCEIANRVELGGLVLIGSATQPSEVSRVLGALHPLANIVPFGLIQSVAGRLPLEMAEMFHDADPGFVRSMCHAIFKWGGLRAESPRPLRIHGIRDIVIPCPDDADLKLDGGHLVSMSHAQACVDFIRARFDLAEGRTS